MPITALMNGSWGRDEESDRKIVYFRQAASFSSTALFQLNCTKTMEPGVKGKQEHNFCRSGVI